MVGEAYEAILEICWYAHYWVYLNKGKKENEKDKDAENEELRNYWERYFDEEAAYESIVEKEHLHDWRGIKKVEDCFYCWKDKYRMGGLDLVIGKIKFVDIMVDDCTEYKLAVPRPRNELGNDILEMTAERLNDEICFHEKILDKIRSNLELDRKIKKLSTCKWSGKPVIRISNTNEIKSLSQTQFQSNVVQKYEMHQKEKAEDKKINELYL